MQDKSATDSVFRVKVGDLMAAENRQFTTSRAKEILELCIAYEVRFFDICSPLLVPSSFPENFRSLKTRRQHDSLSFL